jgi:hypothetical protein
MYKNLRDTLAGIVRENGLESERVQVFARALAPEEAIGRPEERDYPLLTGKERLMSELRTNFHRAVFICTLNAAMNHVGLINKAVHCRDQEPRRCALELLRYLEERFGHPKIAMVGLQPRMVETLSKAFPLRVTDLDPDNIGRERFGIRIEGADRTQTNLIWCDVALVTGTTIVNDTISEFLTDKPTIFYGVTISGAAKILGLNHFCAYGGPR